MDIGSKLYALRSKVKMSQEELAEKLNVSRQAVQKWERGISNPDLENIIKIAKLFSVSVDSLLFDSSFRETEELYGEKVLLPRFEAINASESYEELLLIEYKQSMEEGIDVEKYKDLFEVVHGMPRGMHKVKIADVLFDIVRHAPKRGDYAYDEPSSLHEIRQKSKGYAVKSFSPDENALKSKIAGAWYGRICGCLLGKPVEGIRTDELHPLLKDTGNYPMKRYILRSELTDEILDKYKFRLRDRAYPDTISCAPVDDDTNYTVLGQMIIDKCGRDFKPSDVAKAWLESQPKNAYFTAERMAYLNLTNGYEPPHSALYKNPYREWIGAQIRADYYGYINPGHPAMAAEMAWKDASVSHIKNGIYGAMFVAAMIAAAAAEEDMKEIIRAGLSQIPVNSRLHKETEALLCDYENGMTQEECFSKIRRKYDEFDKHDWCHTLSNALIVTASLLYGKDDYGKSICMAVQAGFDTDCNGATVGSVLGMKNGIDSIDAYWMRPLNEELTTSIFGVGKVKIAELIEKTMTHIKVEF